jgi:integrase
MSTLFSFIGSEKSQSEGSQPAPPRDGFPLQAYANGQWGKKIRGTRRYFGSWYEDPEGTAAEQRYLLERRYWEAGQVPPTRGGSQDAPINASLGYIGDLFLQREWERCSKGKIGQSTYLDVKRAIQAAFEHFGRSRSCLSIRPDNWAAYRDELEATLGPDALDRYVKAVRSCGKWALANEHLPSPLKFGDAFPTVPLAAKEQARRRRAREHGEKVFEPAEIRQILDACEPQLKAMFLLAINAGFTQADCAALPRAAVDLEAGIIDFDRVKTDVQRYVTLWPETVAALDVVQRIRPKVNADRLAEAVRAWQRRKPAGEKAVEQWAREKPDWDGLAFLSAHGTTWCEARTKLDDDGRPVSVSHHDLVGIEFAKVLHGLGLKRPGVSFAAGRHTFRSIAGEHPDAEAVKWIMGHSQEGMSRWYVHKTERMYERLRAVAAMVGAHLLP